MECLPTFTDVLVSSSEALLPPPRLLPTLIRLGLLPALTVSLKDLCNVFGGEPGGELAIAGRLRSPRTKRSAQSGCCGVILLDYRRLYMSRLGLPGEVVRVPGGRDGCSSGGGRCCNGERTEFGSVACTATGARG